MPRATSGGVSTLSIAAKNPSRYARIRAASPSASPITSASKPFIWTERQVTTSPKTTATAPFSMTSARHGRDREPETNTFSRPSGSATRPQPRAIDVKCFASRVASEIETPRSTKSRTSGGIETGATAGFRAVIPEV